MALRQLFSKTRLASNLVRAAGAAGQTLHSECVRLEAPVTSAVRGFATNSHDPFNVHKDTPSNTPESTFAFTPANTDLANTIIARYPSNYKASAVIPLLDLAQTQNAGFLTLAAMNEVGRILEMPRIRVYEVATFYTMFNRSKMGRYHVMVCGTTPCMLNGSRAIESAIKEHLGGLRMGDTTEDGMFTLSEMECMGSCVNAPMIAVADYSNGVEGFSYTYYEDLAASDIPRILDTLRKGDKPQPGSQYRSKAEPAGATQNGKWIPKTDGPQTLTGPPAGPYCRNLDEPAPAA